MKGETRYFTLKDVAVRENADGTRTFSGYAAVYDTPTVIGSGRTAFRESVARGAFDRALAEGQDVRHLINHDANRLLGRTSSGTTRLSSDPIGLRVETDLPDTSYARDLAVLAERGDLNQMSFGFRVPKGGDSWTRGADGMAERTLNDLDALDVSSVTFPAYPETTGEVRSMAEAVASGAEYRDLADPDKVTALLQMIDTLQAQASAAYSLLEGMDALLGEYDPVRDPDTTPSPAADGYNSAKPDGESRAGKVLSQDNAAHLQAALASHADALAHLQAIADAAGITPDVADQTDDSALGDDESLSDGGGGASDAMSVVVGGNSASTEGVESRQRLATQLELLELQAWFEARRGS